MQDLESAMQQSSSGWQMHYSSWAASMCYRPTGRAVQHL